jgi:hypothetical protein
MRRLGRAVLLLTLWSHLSAADPTEGMAQFINQNIGLKNDDSLSLGQLRMRMHSNQETSHQLRNVHDPAQIDRIVTLANGNGLEVQVYVTGPGRALIQRITLTTSQFKLPSGLQINHSSLDEVYKAFGRMGESEKGPRGAVARRFYSDQIGYEEIALLWFDRNRRLIGVEWRYPTD